MKKKIRKIWNRFLKFSIFYSLINIVFWTCCLDSKSIIPIIALGISALWMLLLTIANDPYRTTPVGKHERRSNGTKNQ